VTRFHRLHRQLNLWGMMAADSAEIVGVISPAGHDFLARPALKFGILTTQRRFDFQLAGALKIQLKRGNNETRFGDS